MININSNEAILLKPMEEIRKAFRSELWKRLASLEKQNVQSRGIAGSNRPTISFLKAHSKKLCDALNEETVQSLILSCFTSGHEKAALTDKVASDICFELVEASREKRFTVNQETKFSTVIKLVFVSLWSQEMVVLPKGVSSVKLPNDRMNEIAKNAPSQFLNKIIAVNPSSGLEFNGAVSEKLRKNVCNFWLRLILNTNWTRAENVRAEDIRHLIESASGSKHSILHRYYVVDFLSYLFSDHPELNQVSQDILSDINAVRDEERRKQAEEAHERRRNWHRINYTKNTKRTYKPKDKKEVNQLRKLFSFSQCADESDESLESHIGTNITPHSLRRIFFSKELDVNVHPFYSAMGEKGKKLIRIIDRTFKAFMQSRDLQSDSPYEYELAILLCYMAVYLPRFFIQRDGDLSEYPENLNNLTCSYYIARNEFLSELIDDKRQAPLTYFKFVELIGEKFNWSWNSTTYQHLKIARKYFEYIEHSNDIIPEADKFKSSISDNDIPNTSRGSTTVKNVLPREYFQVFLSLLEALEYFIEHINGMADGVNPCIIGGQITQTNYDRLISSKSLQELWGNGGRITPEIDLSLVNYTPVLRFENKYYPLNRMIRFYTFTPYRVNGITEKRAAPHVPRILWLMANTGIRQKHLLWLNKDSFDAAIPSKPTALSPLIVSTDKSHDEWVSIVSKEVIEVCQKQKSWLERNEIESLKKPMWYSEKKKSRFGKFIPLFRLDASASTWDVHAEVGKVMWMLEKFIRHQLGDVDCPRLAFWKPSNTKETPGDREDYKTDIDLFDRSSVNTKWEWKLYSDYTAHGLRAAFVSEHMRFLPPSLIGRHLTGQFSETLVWFYTIMNAEDIGDHQQLLINLLMKNEDKIKGGGAPELAQKISSMNAIIAKDIDTDPDRAISTHGLFSLSDVDDSKNGIAELKAKKNTQLAFNSTHICPFNNSCPAEVVRKFGLDKPCTVCPYAIRGVMHLPALNAQKFKFVELMEEYGAKIKEYKKRPKTGVIQSEIEGMEAEYDRLTRDSFALEAIEYQLYRMRDAGDQPYIAQDTQTIKDLYENLELDESEHLIKRLIDVQCFPDLDSPNIQRKFARLRYKLMMSTGDVSGLLEDREESEHALLAAQLHSIMAVKELSIRDVFKLASTDVSSKIKPQSVSNALGFETLKLTLKETADGE